jgi:cellobiose phosphorylase
MYPGIPEYVNSDARGIYTWLTGSASWYVLTLVTEVFGVRGQRGDLLLDPKLVSDQFDEAGNASICTLFADRLIDVTYQNPAKLDYGQYMVVSIAIDGELITHSTQYGKPLIARKMILERTAEPVKISVLLGS